MARFLFHVIQLMYCIFGASYARSEDNVLVPRALLKQMVDSCERASKAAGFAVQIAQSARNGFEEERARLAEIAADLARLANRGTIV